MKGVLEERLTRHGELDVTRQGVGGAQVAELRQLPAERPLVLHGHPVRALGPLGRARPRVLERRGARVVVDEVANVVLCVSHFPALRQRLFLHLRGRISRAVLDQMRSVLFKKEEELHLTKDMNLVLL